jgi:hypothetical protein
MAKASQLDKLLRRSQPQYHSMLRWLYRDGQNNFAIRAVFVLFGTFNVVNMDSLCRLSATQLLQTPNIGPGTVKWLEQRLAEEGRKLA